MNLDPMVFESCCNTVISSDDCVVRLCDYKQMEDKYSKPMVWIGIYIAVASLFCILAMAADLFHGFRNRKLWFPCKYFTLNVASITVITVAMKLPMDLNNPMEGAVDQTAKLASMAFMCTMMANLMPSLSSMGNKELIANVIGLVILVITVVVNVLILVETGLLQQLYRNWVIYTYVGMILSLLVILSSSAVTIPTSKQILEFKYQVAHERASNDEHAQYSRMCTVEELIQHVRRYWVMAGTCSPQFVMASTQLCSAAGLICVFSTLIHFYAVVSLISDEEEYYNYKDYRSDYKGNHIKVFEVEKYSTQKLLEWKQSHLAFPLSGRKSKAFVRDLKNLILSLCIGFQKVIVVSCKTIGLIPVVVVIFVVYCLYCWKSLKAMCFGTPASSHDTVRELEQNDTNEDIGNYVLQLGDKMELADRTLKTISNSMNRLIQKAEKEQPYNLLKLLENSIGFEGVQNYDSDQVQPLLSVEFLDSWSLPVVTLTCIAFAVPNIRKDIVDSLFIGVDEGLLYTHLVEESLNNGDEYVNIQRATMTLWHEFEDNCKWMENTLQRNAYKGKTTSAILKWFALRAEEIIVEIKGSTDSEPTENSSHRLIAANSMYHITQNIMLNYQTNLEQMTKKQLFSLLSSMIADIVAACLTSLPRAIAMKCHESAIEKREASVEAATKHLGRSKEIIRRLQMREVPSLDPHQMAFIDEWRVYLKQSIP